MGLINIDALLNVLNQMYKKPKDSEDYMTIGYDHAIADAIITVSKQPIIEVPEWIPIKTRPMGEEERAYYAEVYGWELADEDALIFDCQMPEDGQDVWICTKDGGVYLDVCEVEDGIGLEGNGDWKDIVAWMPHYKPEPWRGEKDANTDTN